MAKGVGFIVGDGKSIKVTGDIWVGEKALTLKVGHQVQDPEKPIWVSSLISRERKWNMEMINHWFDEETTLRIIHIPQKES